MSNIEDKLSELEKQVEQKENNLPMQQENNNPVSFNDLQNKFLHKQVEGGKTLSEIATDFTKAQVTNDLINDKSEEGTTFRKDLANEHKDTIKESFKSDKIKARAKTLDEKKKEAEAFYNTVRPILEFDFSNLIHKKAEDEPKTYHDRSYGIPLMWGMLLFLTIPYFVISILLSVFNGINAVLE